MPNGTRLAPPAYSAASERPRMDIGLAQGGPWSPGGHVPRGVAMLPGEVTVAAPKCQNGLPASLTRDRGAPRTQRGHPATRAALVTRVEQVSPRCWLATSPPRRRDASHAHEARAERARGVRVGLGTSYSASPRRQRTWFVHLGSVLRRIRLCGALPYLRAAPREPQHTPYVRAERARADHTAPTLHPRPRRVHTERLCSRASDPCTPARPLTA